MLIPLPALPLLFFEIEWTPIFPQQHNESQFTGTSQIVGLAGGDHWLATARALPAATEAEKRAWHSFLIGLEGSKNTFLLPHSPRLQTSAASPTVTAAVAGNKAVVVSSAANLAVSMAATVQQTNGHQRLVKITSIAGTTIGITPGLTTNPSIGATLEIGNPVGTVRMVNPRTPLPNIGAPFSLEAKEAL